MAMRWISTFLVLSCAWPLIVRADDAADARRLVRELGDPSFAVREAATRKLLHLIKLPYPGSTHTASSKAAGASPSSGEPSRAVG